jgi:glycosyltransferase involved in cell wall biosynthesis
LAGETVLTGEMADVKPAYAAMDIFVLPSSQPEPFGGVVLEAMGMGLPVVATAIGGSVDQVEERRTGFLVPPADPEAMAERLGLLARDAALRRKMGEAGRERLEKRFGLDEMVDRLVEVYSGILRDKGEGRR